MREFEGSQYWDCDDLTKSEMAIVANWAEATREEKESIRKKKNWKETSLYALAEQ